MRRYILLVLCISFLLGSKAALAALPSAAIDSEPVVNAATVKNQDAELTAAEDNKGSAAKKDKDENIFKKMNKADEADKKRFVLIAKDSRFFYYLDRKSARWIFEPNSSRKIMDVWIQLVDANKASAPADKYSNISADQSYLLDHYYIRPQLRQMQFLCELEVVGQPSNNVTQNVYSVKNWEDIVPGSIEETIFNAVVNTKESLVKIDTQSNSMDIQARDFLDRVLNIGL